MRKIGKDPMQWAAGAFLLLVLFVCLSHLYPAIFAGSSEPVSGMYEVVSEHKGTTLEFKGPVFFEHTEHTKASDKDRVFKLHFIHPKIDSGNGFGFLIPLGEEETTITESRYRILSGDKNGSEPTVFGYADILDEGGGLYFTEKGSISILEVRATEVQGEMNMIMKNAVGLEMKVRGRFSARPLSEDGTL